MPTSKQREILENVNSLLLENGITEAPVDVEGIAAGLNIDVRKTPTEDEISGFLLTQGDGFAVIGVNSLHHPNRQRFTIGHELGHFVLHEKDGVHVDRSVMRLRSATSSTGEDREEIEANRFSAELLMPRAFLDADMEDISSSDFLDDREMQQLAKRYQVSVQAMTRRLIDLGYLRRSEFGIE